MVVQSSEMNRVSLLLAVGLLISLSAPLPSTAADDVPEPEFANVFYGLEGVRLIPLERQSGIIKGKSSGFIVMSTKVVLRFPEGKSPVRFRAGEALQFVVRSPFVASAVDPTTLYHLHKLTAKKHDRETVTTGRQ